MKNFKHRRELKIIVIFLFLSFNLIISISFLYQFGSTYSFSNIGLYSNDNMVIEKELETDSRIVLPNVIIDANGDKISDKLFKKLNLKSRNVNNPQSASLSFIQDDFIDVIIDFNQKPDELIIDKLRYYGAEIKSVYSHVIYAVAAYIPVENITSIANNYEITFIEENSLCKSLLDTSTINIGARGSSYVWEAADPIKGNSSYSIAILDTGIDTTHPDMENVIYFEDFTDNGYPNGTSGTDYGHHGTHCASIAAGTGISDNNPRIINETFSNGLIDSTHYTPHYFEVKENVATPTLLNVTWDNKSGGSVDLVVYPSVGPALGSSISSETSSNFTLDLGNLVSDWYEIMFTPDSPSSSADGKNYSIQVQHEYNYTLSGDTIGTPVFPGVAPNSNLIGLKILSDSGVGNSQWLLDALDWISENGTKSEFNITVVSMSLGFDGIYANIDQAVNSLVSDGFICVAAAGNDGTVQQIRSPGTAEKCITVGAINDAFEITYYSSNGNYTNYKPDVVAPGGTAAYSGSSSIGNLIIAADSNNNESDREMLDIGSNDYTGMQGTSMSCPHIAGIAQLAVDAIIKTDGSSWTWSEQNALKVKQLICMGTWELNQTESFDG
ncbi:MAG: S8 family serine peptidase, partial [archaeon]|nr:S8 family serine peptidase [archaeon]